MVAEVSNEEAIDDLNGNERQSLEALARENDVPLVTVATLYKAERTHLQDRATITTYIPVVATHNVRIKLKQQMH